MAKYQVYIEFGGSILTTVEANSIEEAEAIATFDINCGDARIDYIETEELIEKAQLYDWMADKLTKETK